MDAERIARKDSFKKFLQGGKQEYNFIILDASSYAAEFAGKSGGHPTAEDSLKFMESFPNDKPLGGYVAPEDALPELKWERKLLKKDDTATFYEEYITIPSGKKRRVIAEKKGTTPWAVEPVIKEEADFDLLDYYADCIKKNAKLFADKTVEQMPEAAFTDYIPASTVLIPFEAYYLVESSDTPILWCDYSERYLKSMKKIQETNLLVIEELMARGIEKFALGSPGLELLSPTIFDEGIIPFTREMTDLIHAKGGFTGFHMCGHSKQLLESGRINQLKPTWFETFSPPPCGNNTDLKESLSFLSDDIISKGNLALELLLGGTPEQIEEEVSKIREAAKGRRHIIGQADATILSGTPHENIRAFLEAAED